MAPPLRSITTVAIAIGLASGAFSNLNGGDSLGTAMAVGLLASLVEARLQEPRIAVTVPSIIMMPGLYAFQTIVMLNQGEVLTALQAGANFCFVVGAMAMGLAAARFMTERRWLVDSWIPTRSRRRDGPSSPGRRPCRTRPRSRSRA